MQPAFQHLAETTQSNRHSSNTVTSQAITRDSRPRASGAALLAALSVALAGMPPSAQAERYLTAREALQLCFPAADRFVERTVRFTAEQKHAIEKKSGVRVLNRGQRYWIAWQDTNTLGLLVADHVLGKHEIIDYAVALAPSGEIRQLEVLEFRESHGYEIRGAKWREQFQGKTAAAKLRLNDDIYNLSGATISCRQVTEGVRRVLATFELVLRADLAPGRVPGPSAAAGD